MPLSADRRALLEAIAASPADDLPRLVYADWLDEHGDGDADRTRAEFIRLGCKGKTKARITKAEMEWLEGNWKRLLPRTWAALDQLETSRHSNSWWSGRTLTAQATNAYTNTAAKVQLVFWRGFVRLASYSRGFEHIAGAVALDEPLAAHGPSSSVIFPPAGGNEPYRVTIPPVHCHGRAVWERITGHDDTTVFYGHPAKVFSQPRGPGAGKLLTGRANAAITTAMTAEARHLAGLPEDLPTLGE